MCTSCSTSYRFEWLYYHGMANVEDDPVSKTLGSEFAADETTFFSLIVTKLLEHKYLSTDDILYRIINIFRVTRFFRISY